MATSKCFLGQDMANVFLKISKNSFVGFASPFFLFFCRLVAKIRKKKKKKTLCGAVKPLPTRSGIMGKG
jgi:hypothetical protein